MSSWRRLRRDLSRRYPRTRRLLGRLRHHLGQLILWFRSLPRKGGNTAKWVEELEGIFERRRQEAKLTVGIDVASFWEPLTGIGWYLFRLLEEMAERQDVSIRLYPPSVIDSSDAARPVVPPPTGPALELIQYRVPDDLLLPSNLLIRGLRRLEPLLIAADRNQIRFAPNYFLPRRFALDRGALVATIHDLGVRRVPWTLREETLQELSDRLETTLARAVRLITVSAAVRDELVADGSALPQRVRVIHHGPGHLAPVEGGPLPPGLPSKFALHVGTIEPRKNIEVLLECWAILRQRIENPPTLVLCGHYGWKTTKIQEKITAGQREGWLQHLGYVSDEQLVTLYQKAALVMFPSLYEGFGLPAVEALWAGTPLVCSDIPVLHEVAGEAALYAPVDRPDLLAEAAANLLVDAPLREHKIRLGRRQVGELSWSRAADQTVSVWLEAAAHRSLE